MKIRWIILGLICTQIFAAGSNLFQVSTFDALLNGRFYHGSPTGRLSLVRPDEQTPYATVIFFHSDYQMRLKKMGSFSTKSI